MLSHALLPDRIEVATINHQLRPESEGEAAFVSGICKSLDVPVEILNVEVGRKKLQATARDARYQALAEWASGRVAAVATAHHADDQAETVLMRLNRGSGLSGLVGIRERRRLSTSGADLIRPLLEWRKTELEEVVARAGQTPVRDPSNADKAFDRVRMRENLTETDWLDPPRIAQSATHLAEVEDELVNLTRSEMDANVSQMNLATVYRPKGGPYLRKRVLQEIFRERGRSISLAQASGLMTKLERFEKSNVAGLLAVPDDDSWIFEPEPPRRSD